MIPIFILIGVGFILDRKFKLDLYTLSKLNFYILLPTFVFRAMYEAKFTSSTLEIVFCALVVLILNSILSGVVGKIQGYDVAKIATLKNCVMFKILGDPTRLKIVELLLENEMCVNHIAETMGMGQSAISHQLRVLRQARLVTYRKEGKTAYYSLNDDHVEGLVRMGMEHVSHQ